MFLACPFEKQKHITKPHTHFRIMQLFVSFLTAAPVVVRPVREFGSMWRIGLGEWPHRKMSISSHLPLSLPLSCLTKLTPNISVPSSTKLRNSSLLKFLWHLQPSPQHSILEFPYLLMYVHHLLPTVLQHGNYHHQTACWGSNIH